MTTIFIEWGGECELTPDNVWPDGNVPETFTAADVLKVMKDSCHSPQRLIEDWALGLDDPEFRVIVSRQNPHWQPMEPLLPEHAPTRFITTTATW